MKTPQRVILLALLLLLGAIVVGLELTRPSAPAVTSSARRRRARPRDLVDQQPLRTAQSLAALVNDREERRFAFRALRAADDEVDLAFATALRDAEVHPAPPSDDVRELQKHVKDIQAEIAADKQAIAPLEASLKHSSDPDLQQQLDLAQAQLALHQEDLADAKQDLIRAGGDLQATIQRALAEHEATHAAITGSQAVPDVTAAPAESATLLSHLRAWRALRDKQNLINAAQQEAATAVTAFTRNHDDLEHRLQQERLHQPGAAPPPAAPAPNTAAAIAAMRQVAADVQTLADLDKRIQDEQEMADNYRDWAAVVATHQTRSLHGMFLSALFILLICMAAFAANLAIGRFGERLTPDRRRLRSLHFILRFALQAVALLLILLVVFGAPGQMTFVLGLAGAGLTVALKDFIVAFFGWFVLMGKNGIRVGDWVEIKGIGGEVIEVGLLRTVLLETGQWSDSGHPTGRKVTFVNSFAIEGHFFNFSTSGQWLWDQLDVLVPPGQDPYPIVQSVQEMVAVETEANARLAEQEWQRAVRGHALQSFSAVPAVDVRPTPLGVAVTVRYITRAHERHELRTRLYHRVVELLQGRAIPAAPRPTTSVG